MRFHYSKENLNPQEAKRQRFFEILPGATSWACLTSLILISIFLPFTAAILIVAFYLYWLLRLLYMTFFLILSYFRLNIERKTLWMSRVHTMDNLKRYLADPHHQHVGHHWRNAISHYAFIHQAQRLLSLANQLPPLSSTIYHLVIFPIVNEGKHILEPAIEAIRRQDFPLKQMVVILALEERANPLIKTQVHALAQAYRPHFGECLTIEHPADIVGEARVKGANVTHAAKQAAAYFKEHHIPFDNVVVSCFDADTVVSSNYFACLTYHFMLCPNRQQASFQPIPVYHNNIWHVPGFARVIETGSSFFQLIEATNPEKLVTFSSHSMSFKALVDVDYWPVDMISDDSAIFWKAYIHYQGDYQVIPMYVTLSMDVSSADTWWQAIKNVYKQKRRWAWGVENFPLVMRAFLSPNKIPLWEKIRHGFKLFEGHISWATWGFILSVIGWLPVIFARKEFAASVVYYNVPEIANTILNLGMFSLGITILLSLSLLPKPNVRYRWLLKVAHAFEWLMVPIILVFLSALPALDAQTRLMSGKYLEFWVSDKRRTLSR